MATTTNFGWVTPDNTALVKDGASAIRTLGSSIDSSMGDLKGGTTGQVLAKASSADMDFVWSADAAGMTNPMTTTGDTIYSSSGSTPARLGIGTTGQVLAVSGGLPAWTTLAGAGASYTLLNTGGTALTGSNTVTVSGISNQDKIFVIIDVGSSTNLNTEIGLRINGDTGSNYRQIGWVTDLPQSSPNAQNVNQTHSYFRMCFQSGSNQVGGGAITLQGCKGSGVKVMDLKGNTQDTGSGQVFNTQGFWNNSASITSISAFCSTGTFDAGTIFVYGSSN
jgi:hypothetical protein